MIVIEARSDGISISGHAGYAESGKDIVCAAVSVLAQILVCSAEELAPDSFQCEVRNGNMDVQYGNLSETARTLVDSFFIGARLIADEYPDYVQITQARMV